MYNTADAIPRAEISTVLMEAVGQEKEFIAPMVLPIYDSANEIGRYPRFTVQDTELMKSGSLLVGTTKRGSAGTYNEIDRKFAWDTFQTEEYGLEERVDDVVARRMQNYFDAEMVTAKFLSNNLMIDYEREAAAAIMNPAVFTTTNSSVPYTQANVGSMDVPFDLNSLVERMTILGEGRTVIIMTLPVWNRIRSSAKMQTYMYGQLNTTQGGSQVTPDMFGNAFGVQVIIAKKSFDSALKGKTSTLVPIWGNDYIAVMNIGEGDFLTGGVGRTIVWSPDSPGGLFTSESYRDEPRRSNVLRVRSNRTIKILAPQQGQLLATQWA